MTPPVQRFPWLARVRKRRAKARDGVPVSYDVLGRGDRAVVLANGLGGRLYAWAPLVQSLERNFTVITWDYRGLFESGRPARTPNMEVHDHAEDVIAILDAEKIRTAALVGWSMGVQVGLELASRRPERVDRLVLINGTYGHALSTGFQMLFRIPGLDRLNHRIIRYLLRSPREVERLARLVRGNLRTFAWVGRRVGRISPLMERALEQYSEDVLGTDFNNYLRLFQELDAHSVYHHLPEIPHPTLILSGGLDFLTPAYQSQEMARLLPNARHIFLPWASHFLLLEYPEKAVPPILSFLEEGAPPRRASLRPV